MFKARNMEGKLVAVKVLSAVDKTIGRGFFRETHVWQWQNHPNIVKFHDVNIHPVLHVEMQYCNGGTLGDIKKPMNAKDAAGMVFNISTGLLYAHSLDKIHLDLKPTSILLSGDLPKITDWGLSRILSDSGHSLSYSISLPYAAPEQVSPDEFGSSDERTDIYRLGVIFYELATGRLPFGGDDPLEISAAITTREPEKPSSIDPDLGELDIIITKAMAKQKPDRYQNMGEFQNALSEYLKLEIIQSLENSVSEGSQKTSAYHYGDLLAVYAKMGDVKGALEYTRALKRHVPDEFEDDVADLAGHLERCLKNDEGVDENFFTKIDAITSRAWADRPAKAEAQTKGGEGKEQDGKWHEELEWLKRKRKGEEKRQEAAEDKRRRGKEAKRRNPEKQIRLAEEQLAMPPATEEITPAEKSGTGSRKHIALLALALIGSLVLGVSLLNSDGTDDSHAGDEPVHTPEETSETLAPAPAIYGSSDLNSSSGVLPHEFTNSLGMEFVLISPGEFYMGSPVSEEGRDHDENPAHRIKISKPFYVGKYEVTQDQWHKVMGDDPSYFSGNNNPVESVSRNDVQGFIYRLNEKEGTDKYRLLTGAEWEYAARAGTQTRYSFGDDESKLGEYAWYVSNSGGRTHPVGLKKPNPWGLYDMHGNVWEWVQDWHGSDRHDDPAYRNSQSWKVQNWRDSDLHDDHKWVDPQGSPSGTLRITRSGSWDFDDTHSRSASVHHYKPEHSLYSIGFRVAKSL